MRLSLRYRLMLPLTLLLIGDAAATAWAASAAARGVDRRLAAQQWAVARTLTEPPFFPLTEPVLKKMQDLSGAEFLFTLPAAPSQSTFPDPKPEPPTDVPTATQPGSGEEHTLGPPVVVGGREYRCLRLPLKPPHPNAGGNLYIFYPESLRRTAVRDAVRPLIILGGGGGLIAFALTVAFGSQLVRRVRDLDARTRLIAAGDFRPMPVPAANDELRDLCESVNDMARRLATFQEELQRTERLRVLGQFSGGLAHQLRNAATGARLALEVYWAENPAADPEPLRVAMRQLARIEANLRQFLNLGKPSARIKVPCDLVKLVDEVVGFFAPRCLHTKVHLSTITPDFAVSVPADPEALTHVLVNLVENAIDAAGPGGSVRVIGPCSDEGVVWIEIEDTGPGPPPEVAGRLFEPFVTGKEQGVGLGLAVAKQAADAHGGTITWQRRDGKTVFRIELPIVV